MGPRGRRAAIVATIVVLSMLVAGGGGRGHALERRGRAGSRRGTPPTAASSARSTACSRKMTVDEKLQQVQLLVRRADHRRRRRRPASAAVFSLADPAKINHFQHVAVEQSRLHIPILFAYDTIHGYRTIFPIPLGAASSFDPSVATADDTIAARETATVGIKQIYSPMVDVSHEPRWGRIAEGARRGPVPRLGVRRRAGQGRAGHRLLRARQGRHERQALRRLRPARGRPRVQHHRHVRAAAAQPLPAAVQGRDRRRRRHRDVLVQRDQRRPGLRRTTRPRPTSSRSEWGFDGFIESDYTAVAELRACPPKNPDSGPVRPRRRRRRARRRRRPR